MGASSSPETSGRSRPLTLELSAEAATAICAVLLTTALAYLYVLYRLINDRTRQNAQQESAAKRPSTAAAEPQPNATLPSSNITAGLPPSSPSVSFFDDAKDKSGAALASPPASPVAPKLPRRRSYRIEEEGTKKQSSEYTRRGQLWSRHASWHLPLAPRDIQLGIQERQLQGIEHVSAILKTYDVDPHRGFLPSQDPLQRLPYARYHLWEDLADDLPKLLGARLGQAREPLRQLPALSTDKLVTDAELRRAHLLLCLFAHAYVWGGLMPLDVIPEGIAKPLWEVSERLGIPPILSHTSIVLYNWRRLDAEADVCMENLSTLNNFFDGRDESWFYLITVEVEARGAAAIVPMMLAIDAISRFKEEQATADAAAATGNPLLGSSSSGAIRGGAGGGAGLGKSRSYSVTSVTAERDILSDDGEAGVSALGSTSLDEGFSESRDQDRYIMIGSATGEDNADALTLTDALIGKLALPRVAMYVTGQLRKIATAVRGMVASLSTMREGCHPFIFYHRVRPFLSGWKHNPTLKDGVLYQGVTADRQQFYGGSAAQSSLLPFLDITLGVSHENSKSKDFLLAMRDYMPRRHREFLLYIETVACVREFVTKCLEQRPAPGEDGAPSMDCAADVWTELRDAYDECIEALKQFRTGHISLVAEYIMAQQRKGEVQKGSLEGTAGGKGTGGTDLMKFLKPIRDNCRDSLLGPPDASLPVATTGEEEGGAATTESNESTSTAAAPYTKDNANFEDIDLYRGGTGISSMSAGIAKGYKLPVVGW